MTSAATLSENARLAKRKTAAVLAHLERLGAISLRGEQVTRRIAIRDAREIQMLLEGYAKRAAGDRARLAAMEHFAQAVSCRTRMVLEYFGEATSGTCHRCDYCAPRGMS